MPDEHDIAILRERAAQARNLAKAIGDAAAVKGLLRYAEEQDGKADELEATPVLPQAAAVPSGEPPLARAGAALKPEAPEKKPEPDDR